MSAPENSPPPQAHALRAILVLALAPAIGLGIGRFAYSLVLPDMRDALGWSYATAGFMNTINAAGYLAGALGAAAFIRRYGLFAAIWVGTVACVISLALCAITGNVIVFSFARLLAGLGAAIAFIAGGAMAAAIAQSRPAQSAILLGLFYTGPALGIIISGLAAPFLLEGFGPGSWWIVWTVVTAISTLLTVPLLITRIDAPPFKSTSTSNAVPLRPILAYLAGYFLFGAGYIAYMTFMIAYIRDAGGSAAAQSGFWCLIGLSSFVSPWAWRRLMTRGDSGMTTGILIGITAIGTGLALFGTAPALLAASAFVFGTAFFAVVTATTVFTRINYPPASWPKVIGILTVAFGLGQTFGPIATGAITDAMGSLTYALNVSAAALALGALACACQRRLVTSSLAS